MWGRRGFLGLVAGLLGWLGFRPAAARAPIYPDPSDFDPKALPYPFLEVSGERALAEWERIRAEGKAWPVIIGDANSASYLEETFEYETRTPEQVIAAADALAFPEALLKLRRAEHEESLAHLRGRPSDEVAYRVLDGSEKDLVAEDAGRAVTVGELLKQSEADDGEPDLGAWPSAAESYRGLASITDYRSNAPFETVYILLIPTSESATAPAYLRFGAWNACPPPEYQVATLRALQARYGAELVICTNDAIELRVKRRPETREEALELARGLYAYCNDSIDQGHGTLSAYAAYLMASDWWYFWWD